MEISEQKILPNIIIDLGSNTIKFGMSCDLFPKYIIPNMIGKIKEKAFSPIKNYNNYYFGFEALYNSPSLDITYPLIDNNGRISRTVDKDYEKIFQYIFKEAFQIDEAVYNVFILTSIFTSVKEMDIIAEILFEKFKTYNLHFEPQSIMTLFSTSKTSGLIVNSGEITTEIIPIYEGYIISDGISEFPFAGYELTKRFMEKYKNDFELNNVNNHYYMAQKIKESFSEILPGRKDYENMINKKEYILPDGNIIQLGNEIYQIPELIFSPEIFDIKSQNLPQIIVDSINKCNISVRKELFNNIILGGGNTCIKGFESRLKNEINSIKKKNCGIICLEERSYASWIGASRISTLGNFEKQWISKNDYLNKREIIDNNYLFNYSGLKDKIIIERAPDELYEKFIIPGGV